MKGVNMKKKTITLRKISFYETDNKRKVVFISPEVDVLEAKRIANEHFKTRLSALSYYPAWVKGDFLYFDKVRGGEKGCAVWKTL